MCLTVCNCTYVIYGRVGKKSVFLWMLIIKQSAFPYKTPQTSSTNQLLYQAQMVRHGLLPLMWTLYRPRFLRKLTQGKNMPFIPGKALLALPKSQYRTLKDSYTSLPRHVYMTYFWENLLYKQCKDRGKFIFFQHRSFIIICHMGVYVSGLWKAGLSCLSRSTTTSPERFSAPKN